MLLLVVICSPHKRLILSFGYLCVSVVEEKRVREATTLMCSLCLRWPRAALPHMPLWYRLYGSGESVSKNERRTKNEE